MYRPGAESELERVEPLASTDVGASVAPRAGLPELPDLPDLVAASPGLAPLSAAERRLRVKRALDLIGAVALLILTAPLIALAAIAVRLDSHGPAFFAQERIGKGGRRFRVFKLRTMVADAESRVDELRPLSRDPHWLALDDDPRVTRVGRVLRRLSLDELPQLWNVIRGEMSLVGPRPLPVAEDMNVPAWGRSRAEAVPGITGLWQVSGRNELSFAEMVELDREYVTTWSLRRDLRLLLATVPAVLTGRGAV